MELPVSSLFFDFIDEELNLIVGNTFGYLVIYNNVDKFQLNNNRVLNNENLQESIIDIIKEDIDFDGK